MNVSLTDELERFIAGEVESGRYRSASEVVRDAVRLLRDRAEERAARIDALREAVGVGLADLDAGRAVDGTTAFEDVLRSLRARE